MSNKDELVQYQITKTLGEVSASLREIETDIKEIKALIPRVNSLEQSRSYAKGALKAVAVLGALVTGLITWIDSW